MILFDLIIGMLFVSGISMAALGLDGRRFVGRIPAAPPYVLLMFSAAAWAVLYALDLLTASLPLRVFYHDLRFLFLPFFSVLELWLIIAYLNKTEWLRRDLAAAVLAVPVLAAVLALTSPYHTLFRYGFWIDSSGPVTILQYSESPFFVFYSLYSLILVVLAILILIAGTRKRGTLWEMQTVLLLLALATPTAINYAFQAGLTPIPGVNMAPALLWVPAILFTIALFRYRFLDIAPVARSRLIETMSTPMLVLDTGGRIVDLNPAAASLFSLPPATAPGKSIEKVVPDWQEFLALCRAGGKQERDITIPHDSGRRLYTVSTEPLLAGDGKPEASIIFLQDITERKNAEQALRDSEARLQSILHGSPVLQFVIDRNHRVISWNRAIEEYSGIKSSDIIGTDQQWRPFYPARRPVLADILVEGNPELLDRWYAGKIRKSRYVEGAYEAMDFFPAMGTSGIWLEFTAAPVRDAQGTIIGAVETLEDITERRKAEDALRESEEKFREIFNNASDAFHLHEIDENGNPGKFIDLNDVACRMLQYSRDEFMRHTPLDFATDYHSRHLEEILKELRTTGHVMFETGHRRRDGVIIPVEVHAHIIELRGKRVTFSVVRDITERKAAAQALRESEENYRNIIENMQDTFYRTDLAGKLTMLSPSAVRLAGYPSVEYLIGRDISVMYANPEDREKLLEILRQKGSVDGYPVTLMLRDGTPIYVTISSHLYRDARGVVQGVEGIIHDVTDLKRAEAALRMANRKMNLLTSITRHNIRNQVFALKGYFELMGGILDNPSKLAEYLEREVKIADSIERQITFTKDYEDMGVNAPVWQNVNECVSRAVAGFPRRDVRINMDLNDLEVYADPLLEKVFYNLIDNTLRYGGEKLTAMNLSFRAEGISLVLIFEDDGDGVAFTDKPRLFEKGFGRNTGLGLFLSREILSITGITIAETGVPGKGARFEMMVPAGGFRFAKPVT
jgi:PAS domain S-box-containing protein